MTVAFEEIVHNQSDMATLYQQKLAVEGASPKPCIIPGNALQLIDDNPTESRSHTPSSVIILDDDEGNRREISLDTSVDQAESEIGSRPYPVFASARECALPRISGAASIWGTARLSESGSRSSSIPAPIRWHADKNKAWGPLGQRLSAYAQANGKSKRTSGLL
jgi:hypothetical protein